MDKILEFLEGAWEAENRAETIVDRKDFGGYFHAAAGAYISKIVFDTIEERGYELSKNQKRVIGYSSAFLAGHLKERYRDDIYNPKDLPSWVLGAEIYIQSEELMASKRYDPELEDLAKDDRYDTQIERRVKPLGKIK